MDIFHLKCPEKSILFCQIDSIFTAFDIDIIIDLGPCVDLRVYTFQGGNAINQNSKLNYATFYPFLRLQ